MNPHDLVGPPSALGYPTPFWFIELFKVLGFSLHVAPMNLWYAGALLAIVLRTFGNRNARIVGHHIARVLPFAIAFGINFGIIPLLFLQVAYHQFFYPATILMAWAWFSVFWLVMAAYFLVYMHRLSMENRFSEKLGKFGGWIAAGIFIVVGFIFANALSMTTRVGGWWGIFHHANHAGAPTGFALNIGDPTLIPRWLFMFGLALTTTAVFIAIDAAYLSDKDGDDYRIYARRFAAVTYSIGMLWFIGFGSWYIFGTRPFAFPLALQNPVMRIVFPLTAVSPGLPWLLILIQQKRFSRKLAALTGVAQFVVIALNATSRQWLQNVELSPYIDLAKRPAHTQVLALVMSLALFVIGLLITAWIITRLLEVTRAEAKKNST